MDIKQKLEKGIDVIILAIETSCDDTSVAVVKNGRTILSNCISSQIDIHNRFGGVVPEVASRNHITAIDNVTHLALEKANITFEDVDAIAVTYGAGLLGSLLVGVSYAKSLAYSLNKPLIAVNHIEGHIAGNYISHKSLEPPFVCLVVSGGHTALLNVTDYNQHILLGTTLDDAVGEAFDKVARVLSLGYPGGPIVEKTAQNGDNSLTFGSKNGDNLGLNFSFSGKKTAVINYIHKAKQNNIEISKEDVCASFLRWSVDDLSKKAILACSQENINKLCIAGGVSANKHLRKVLEELCKENNIDFYYPDMQFCMDNAAMIGCAGYYYIKNGGDFADMSLSPVSNLPL